VSGLRDRLERLRLERLEREATGASVPELPLKQRLERLVAAAAHDRRRPSREPVPIERLVSGQTLRNDSGECFVVDSEVHLETGHGLVPLTRFCTLLPETVGILSGEPELGAFDMTRAVFLDTETTGLAGGTGTAAFLIGIGFVEGDHFRVRQYLMRDYHEEPAQLAALAQDLAPFTHLVTYNGKMFDVPLLESRYRLNRTPFPLSAAAHLDLLHPARRLWKLRLESCRLQSLESKLLGIRRTDDVPGQDIPHIYFEYVRSRHAGLLPRILEHNRIDILSLAALAIVACQWVEGGYAEDARDAFSLGRIFERVQLYARSEAEYARALASEGCGASVRGASLVRLARAARRAGEHARAGELWATAASAGEAPAFSELAKHLEHRMHDLRGALATVDRGLAVLRAPGSPAERRAL
jgi:uncharacterized protein YprB with RNaseH-like and TPR domain